MNTKNVKVTMKNSKEQMLRFLEATYPTIKDNKDVAKRVEYTLGNHEKAKKSEVFEVVEEVQEVLMTMPENVPTEEEKPVPVENEVKKSPKKPKVKKSEPVENEVKKPAKTKAKPTVKKTEEKTKKDTKEVTAPTAAKLPETAWPLAMMFPQELTVPNLGKLKAVPETTMEDIVKRLSDGKQYFFACYWTARQIKEFSYSEARNVPCPKSFPNDLDILEPVYFCDGIKRMHAISLYTEALFSFNADALEHVEDTNPYTGEKFRIRVSNGMEFELYELVQD